MLRHHSLGPAELAALMGAWHPQKIAVEARVRWIVAFDAAVEESREQDAGHAGAVGAEEGKACRP